MSEKVVNIIGLGWSSVDAPFDNGERWGVNCGYIYGPLDRLFWMISLWNGRYSGLSSRHLLVLR